MAIIKLNWKYAKGELNTDTLKLICLPARGKRLFGADEMDAELCIKDGMNYSIAEIHLGDVNGSNILCEEIARRWNNFHEWRNVTDEQYPTDRKVLCRMKSNGAIVSGYIYKENGIYKVATSSDFHFEDYGNYECDLYMLIPEIPQNSNE